MKWFMIAGLVVGVITALSLAGTSEGSVHGKDPFIGAWESIDTDGSYQRLSIGGGPGGRYHLAYLDHYASICGGEHATLIGFGMGEMMDDTHELMAVLPVRCLESNRALNGHELTLRYDADRGLLIGDTDIEWKRQGANMGPPPKLP